MPGISFVSTVKRYPAPAAKTGVNSATTRSIDHRLGVDGGGVGSCSLTEPRTPHVDDLTAVIGVLLGSRSAAVVVHERGPQAAGLFDQAEEETVTGSTVVLRVPDTPARHPVGDQARAGWP